MGLFDFFGKKKKEEQDAAELLKAPSKTAELP